MNYSEVYLKPGELHEVRNFYINIWRVACKVCSVMYN
jgi:hypothetical protein